MNSDVHTWNTRFNHDLHLPAANLTIFPKWGWYCGIKFYNHLPLKLKELSDDIPKFKMALKKFLLTNSILLKNTVVGIKDSDSIYTKEYQQGCDS
jgi:hypothetical protein